MKKIQNFALILVLLMTFSNARAQFTVFTTSNSDLPSDFVCGGVAVDTSNNVWLGTDAGVAKFDGATWTVFTTADGLPSDIITCIVVDKSTNTIWIGTDGDGVGKYNGSSWTTYKVADGLCDNGIHYIACETDGTTWFGSWGAGISKLHNSTWTTYTDVQGFPSFQGAMASVYYIAVDGANNKWFGTDLGLVKYNNTLFDTITPVTMPNMLNRYIMAVAVDSDDNKWLGVQYKGIARLNSSDAWVANYDTTKGICNNGITDIKISSGGKLWLGEYTKYGALIKGGITKFDAVSGTGVSYSSDGLFEDQVFAVDLGKSGNVVWAATGEGLLKYVDQTGIGENSTEMALDIYPNPANQYLNITGELNSAVTEISDMTGQVCFSGSTAIPAKIDIRNFSNGIYILKMVSNDKVYVKKFIKE